MPGQKVTLKQNPVHYRGMSKSRKQGFRKTAKSRRDNSPPPVLYKYLDSNGADKAFSAKGTVSVKFTPPNQFNDPFDCSPGGFKHMPESELRKSIVECMYNHEREFRDKFQHEGLVFEEIVRGYLSGLLAIDNVETARANASGNLFQADFSKGVAILSLSEKNRNLLMWSHYAEQHRGIVLGIKSRAFSRFSTLFVRYSKQRPKMGPGLTDDEDQLKYTTKSPDWEYEAEWRVVAMKLHLCRLDDNGGDDGIFLHEIPPEEIDSVILGIRFEDPVLRWRISDYCAKHPNIKLFQAKQDLHQFQVNLDHLNP